jgi:transposase
MSEASELKMGVVEVIPPVQQGRRRKFTADEKRFFLEKSQAPGESISSVARRYGLSTSLLFRWRRLLDEGTMSSLGTEETLVPESELKKAEARIRELERLLGKKTLENEILKEAVELARSKKLLSQRSLPAKAGIP